MSTLFLVCVVVGTTILVAQIVLTLLGLGGGAHLETAHLDTGHVGTAHMEVGHLDASHGDAGGEADGGDGHQGAGTLAHGLDLLSVRALSAALAMFGVAGLGFSQVLPSWLAGVFALVPAFLTAAGTAYLTRQMLRLESSGSLHLEGTVGQEGSVYLTIPADSLGSEVHGLVHVMTQGRTVELRAVTREPTDLPTGSAVVVIAVEEGGETVEVVPPSTLEGPSHEPTQ